MSQFGTLALRAFLITILITQYALAVAPPGSL